MVAPPVYLALGAILVVLSIVALAVPFRASRRTRARDSAETPPRSVSPARSSEKPLLEQKFPNRVAPEKKSASIAEILSSFIPGSRKPLAAAPTKPSNAEATNPVTNRTDAEIDSYGDFPDYAALSGVPLPAPYQNFDINKALPRPYRPFRWAYHQTMCTFCTRAYVWLP